MTIQREPNCKIFEVKTAELYAVAVRELFVRDDWEIALRCDANIPTAARDSGFALMQAQKREAVRLSIVAVQRGPEEPWERVNAPQPFMEMDEMLATTYTKLLQCHNDLNGVRDDEDFRKGARRVSSVELLAMIGRAPGGTTAPDAATTGARAGT